MKNGLFLILALSFLTLLILFTLNCSLVHAENSYIKISANSYEISYDNSTNLFVYPLEHSIDRIIHVKNTGTKKVRIVFKAGMNINGKETEVPTWPQPMPNHLEPGDERDFVMKIEWSSDITSSWQENKTFEYPIFAEISVDNDPVKITLFNQVLVEKTPEHVQEIKTNSKISGYAFDSSTSGPIKDAEVEVWSNGPRVMYRVKTDSSGYYSVPVRGYQRSFLKNYIQYSIRIRKNGYEDANYAVSPRENEEIKTESRMAKETERGNYRLMSKIYTGLPPARVDFSNDYNYFATVPFHSSEKIGLIKDNAYLHFFSSNGSLLWKYKLDNEIPTVDVSDDGSLVVTAHRPSVENWNGGDYIMLFDHSGNLTWTYRIPGIGDWSLPNYVNTPDGVDDGITEVRISHDNNYLAAGTWTGKFFLIDLGKKKVLWNRDLNDGQVRFILFKEDDSSVYVGSDPFMFRYDMEGNLIWKAFIGSWPYNMALSKNYVFVGPKVGRFVSLFDKNTGNVIWRYPVDARPDNLLISPDESYFVYQSSNGDLAISNAFFNASGELMFNLQGANGGYITNDSNYMAYYGSDSVHLINRRGDELWSSRLDPVKWPAPRGAVYVSDDKRKITVADSMTGYVYFFEGGIERINENNKEMGNIENIQPYQNDTGQMQKKNFWQEFVDWFSNTFSNIFRTH
jgi:outer membrane protein assembly factor BamB